MMLKTDKNQVSKVIEHAPPFFPIPAVKYGGSERVIGGIVNAWAAKEDLPFGVELWAPGDSKIKQNEKVSLKATVPAGLGLGQPYGATRIIMENCADLRQTLENEPGTVAHFHIEDYHFLTFGYEKELASKTLTTLHNLPKPWQQRCPYMPLVAISYAQKKKLDSGFEFVEVVHNGIDPSLFEPNYDVGKSSPASFIGRFCDTKNPIGAINIAFGADVPIRLGGVRHEDEMDYFQRVIDIEQKNPDKVQYIGEVSDEPGVGGQSSKSALLGKSRALIFPIKWAEPFGLVIAEANACGTPVIAFDHPGSSVSELIVDGVNGYKVKTEEEAVEALKHIENIDRRGVHKHFQENFTIEKMADKYQSIIHQGLPRYWKDIGVK